MRKLNQLGRTLFNAIRHEAVLWTIGLAILAIMDPASQTHFSLCPLQNLGIDWCPGCGLGHSISYALHGDMQRSLHAHPFGLFGLLVLASRIASLASSSFAPEPIVSLFSHERKLHG